MPETDNDRLIDNWTPLFTIAQVAGDPWPDLIKNSMLKMMDIPDENIGLLLLQDIREIFNSRSCDRIFSDDLVEALKDLSEQPWADWRRGKGLTQNGLASLLKPFDVRSKTLRIGDGRRKGYELDNFQDAFNRYLSSDLPVSTVTMGQINNSNNLNEKQTVTSDTNVTDGKQDKQLRLNDCHNVTDQTGGSGKNIEKCFDCPACDKINGICYAKYHFEGMPDSGVRCFDAIKTCNR
jgi:hypothetical protein